MVDVVIHSEGGAHEPIASALAAEGLAVAIAPDGRLGAVQLLDLRLSDATKVAANAGGATVIVLVDVAEHERALAQLGRGFDDVIVKPAGHAELVARVRAGVRTGETASRRSRSLRMVAHDVNNPLTAIRLLAEMLATEVDSIEAKQDMKDILEASDLAAAYIESLSALAKLDSLRSASASGSADAAVLFTTALRRPCIRDHVEAQPAPGPLVVRADRGALQQAILDMLLNARRLTEGRSSCRAMAIEHDGAAVITVEAVAASIPEDMLHLLFEPFGATVLREARVQVSPAGLAHAHQLAGRVGGSLRVLQGPAGVRFQLRVPLAPTA